jgi:hypothetical protein
VTGAVGAGWDDPLMPAWTEAELDTIGAAQELTIAPRRADGGLRAGVPIWVVRVGDDLLVRSYRGRSAGWFRHALEQHEAHVEAGGVQWDVRVEEPADADHALIDQEYRDKYARYGDAYVLPMVAPEAIAATLRLIPAVERP